MNFNFYEEYKSYSNIDLLKVVKQPGNYQTGAVEAATQVLKERSITDAEVREVDEYLHSIEEKEQIRKDKISGYKEKATDFFEPVLKPGTDVTPGKWVNILLVLIALHYAWALYKTTKHLIRFLGCESCSFDIFIVFELLILIYIPIVFYLLYKKARWGWILLFADNLFTVLSQLGQLYLYFRYWNTPNDNILAYLLPIVIRVAFAFFLLREKIACYFGVTPHTKMKAAVVTTVITLLLSCGLMIVTW